MSTAMAITGDDRMLACGYVPHGDGRSGIRLWDLKTGREVGRFELADKNRIESLAFAPDDRSLTSGMGDGTGLVWDIREARAKLPP